MWCLNTKWGGAKEKREEQPCSICSQLRSVCVLPPPPVCLTQVLSTVSPRCLTFPVIYDSFLPKITSKKLFARLPVWPDSAVWGTWMSQRGAEDAAIQYPPSSSARGGKRPGSNYFVSGNNKITFPMYWLFFQPFFLVLDCFETAYLSVFIWSQPGYTSVAWPECWCNSGLREQREL